MRRRTAVLAVAILATTLAAFSATDSAATSQLLAVFALGLPAFVLIKVFSPAYFAREDTATPMRYATISLTANTIGSAGLFFLFRDGSALSQRIKNAIPLRAELREALQEKDGKHRSRCLQKTCYEAKVVTFYRRLRERAEALGEPVAASPAVIVYQ